MNLRDYDLVIWDCDGVLVDSEVLTVEVEQRMLAELGWPMTREEVVASFMGRTLASEVAEIRERLGAEAAHRFETELVPTLEEVFERDLEAVAGVPQVLDSLASAGVAVCVASSGTPSGIRRKLARTGLTAYFGDRISSGVEVEHGKPAPDLFLLAASRMGVEPSRCVVVEDSVHGVTGGVAAGMAVLGYAGGLAPEAELRAAGATTFATMAELEASQVGWRLPQSPHDDAVRAARPRLPRRPARPLGRHHAGRGRRHLPGPHLDLGPARRPGAPARGCAAGDGRRPRRRRLVPGQEPPGLRGAEPGRLDDRRRQRHRQLPPGRRRGRLRRQRRGREGAAGRHRADAAGGADPRPAHHRRARRRAHPRRRRGRRLRGTAGGSDAGRARRRRRPRGRLPGHVLLGHHRPAQGVQLRHRNLIRHTVNAHDGWTFDPGDKNLVAMPLFHVGGSSYVLFGIHDGIPSVMTRDPDGASLAGAIMQGANRTFLVPAVLAQVLQSGPEAIAVFGRLKTYTYGAAPMPLPLLRAAIEAWPDTDFIQVYGLTEVCGVITHLMPPEHRDPEHPERLVSAGKVIPEGELRVVDPVTLEELPVGEHGELWFRTPQLMKGFLNRPEETDAVITADGWFRTGDMGRVDADGYVYVEDRLKDMIITGGENVYSPEVERVLAEHPAVMEVAVIGVPDDRWGETVKAVVSLHPGASVTGEELITYCREHLARFKCPTSVDVLEALPRNPTGKILKRDLRKPYWDARDRPV